MTILTDEQRATLRSLNLPDELNGLSDELWFEVEDRLGDEMQLHGINEAGDGTNEHGQICVGILNAMAQGDGEGQNPS